MATRKKFELDKLQQKTLSLLANSPLSKNFYWTGGAALSYLYLQHRKSEDIDLFSGTSFEYNLIR
jgi:predicted nucleotidyltransferase component of viral defense system